MAPPYLHIITFAKYLCLLIITISLFSCSEEPLPINFNCDAVEFSCLSVSPRVTDEPSIVSRLRVVDNTIVDDNCSCQVIRGITIPEPFFLLRIDREDPLTYLTDLKDNWNVDIIRIPVHPELWSNLSNYKRDYLDPIVEIAGQLGIYTYVGWYAHGNIDKQEPFLPDWRNRSPWRGNPYDVDIELATSFFDAITEDYKTKPWVVYGVFNEPCEGIDWDTWKPYAEDLADIILDVNPESLVFVSGTNFGYDLSDVPNNPLRQKNIVYETHPYPHKGESWKRDILKVQVNYPVYVGEWGFCDDTTLRSCDESLQADQDEYGEAFLQFCKDNKIGWTAWIHSPTWTPNLFDRKGEFTNFGELVHRSLKE